jgi:hypothetical protein
MVDFGVVYRLVLAERSISAMQVQFLLNLTVRWLFELLPERFQEG